MRAGVSEHEHDDVGSPCESFELVVRPARVGFILRTHEDVERPAVLGDELPSRSGSEFSLNVSPFRANAATTSSAL
jgi:hypothetical protein